MASRKTKMGSTNSPDKKLPLNKSIPLGIQHVLAMFASNVTPSIIIAGAAGFAFGGGCRLNGCAHDKGEPLLLEDTLEGALYVGVHTGGDGVHIFDHSHL